MHFNQVSSSSFSSDNHVNRLMDRVHVLEYQLAEQKNEARVLKQSLDSVANDLRNIWVMIQNDADIDVSATVRGSQ